MTEQTEANEPAPNIPSATIRRRRLFSPVWIVPLVTAAIAGYLLYDFLANAGPKVTITFPDGQNISTTATVRYRGVQVGKVLSIDLTEDLKHVVVEARLSGSAAGLARANTKFWIVRPEISLSGVSGLSTIVSGSYITLEPGDGKETYEFTGLAQAPDIATEEKGREFVLEGTTLHSATVGTPILYHQVEVGQVIRTSLSSDRAGVDIRILVKSEFAPLVRKNSIFWDASGIHADFSVFKATVVVESISSLLKGGIAFANPRAKAEQAEANSIFQVHEDPPPSYLVDPVGRDLHIVLTADRLGSVRENDPVYYREFQVGHVSHVELSSDSLLVDMYVVIEEEYAALVRTNSVFWNASGLHLTAGLFSGAKVDIESLQSLIAGGIAFATPDQPGATVKNGTVFFLRAQGQDDWKTWSPRIQISPAHQSVAQDPTNVGTDSDTLRNVQEALKAAGYYTDSVDGLYGPHTRTAILNYQKASGLDETGIPDETTLAKLLPQAQ